MHILTQSDGSPCFGEPSLTLRFKREKPSLVLRGTVFLLRLLTYLVELFEHVAQCGEAYFL